MVGSTRTESAIAAGNTPQLGLGKAVHKIPAVVDMDGAGGNKISIQNSPPTAPLVYVAKSKKPRYTDHGMNWEISDRNSFHSPTS
jgi:hypothetical protein